MKFIKRLNLTLFANIILFSSLFLGSLYIPTDSDLGWHLKYGEYFFKYHHILRDNPFTQLMPTFHWTNSSWATDLLTYTTFHHFGFIGVSVLGALTITTTLFFLAKSAKLGIFEKSLILPVLWFVVGNINSVSFRGQLLTLLFLSVLYYILSIYQENKKKIFWVLPLFLLWSNFHGEYFLGLAVFLIWVSASIAQQIFTVRRLNFRQIFEDNKFLLTTLLGSFFVVLVNPFGVGVYQEVFTHINNPLVKYITEYLPLEPFSDIWWEVSLLAILSVFGVIILGFGKSNKNKFPFLIPPILLSILTFWIRRYSWPFFYSSVFLLAPVAKFLKPDTQKASATAGLIISTLFLVGIIFAKYPLKDVKNMSWDLYCQKANSCSSSAAQFVISHKLNNDKLLTIYDYGGWLIWNYPQIKPTIDGRMHLWRDEKGFSAFAYYYPIEQNLRSIDSTSYTAVLTSHKKTIYNELMGLSKTGEWKKVFDDDSGAVFVKK